MSTAATPAATPVATLRKPSPPNSGATQSTHSGSSGAQGLKPHANGNELNTLSFCRSWLVIRARPYVQAAGAPRSAARPPSSFLPLSTLIPQRVSEETEGFVEDTPVGPMSPGGAAAEGGSASAKTTSRGCGREAVVTVEAPALWQQGRGPAVQDRLGVLPSCATRGGTGYRGRRCDSSAKSEIEARIARVQAALTQNQIDCAIVVQYADLFYLAGTAQQSHLLVPQAENRCYWSAATPPAPAQNRRSRR